MLYEFRTRPDIVWPHHEDVYELRATALRRMILASIAFAVLWIQLQITPYSGALRPDRLIGPLLLGGSGALAYHALARRRFLPAVVALLLGLGLAILAAARSDPGAPVACLWPLAAGASGLLLGPAAGFAVAGAIAAGLLGAAIAGFLPLPAAVVASAGALATAVVTWVAVSPLQMVLHWAWLSYERAWRQTEALRDQRGELQRVLKDLEGAYQRLERMNLELERARRAADEARRLKAEFAANVSHELRTPLNLIVGFSEMMLMAPDTYGGELLPPAYRGDLEAIYRNAEHLSHLIDDILDLSQIEAGRMGLVKAPLSPRQVIEEAVATVEHLFTGKGLTLTVDAAADLPTVPADRTRIRQVLINLLTNAARFTQQGGVQVRAHARQSEVVIAVADTGIGIPAEGLVHMFEEFRQVTGPLGKPEKGSGLGLAVSRKFVELHGGRMWAESQVGQGTTVFFTLPVREELAASAITPAWETRVRLRPAAPERGRVIVVDPDPGVVRLFQRYLDGYQVEGAADAAQALHLASRQLAHALIVTASSGEEGWQRLRQAREGLPNLPVVVCTLRSGLKSDLPRGVRAYLVKPISRAGLLSALRQLGTPVRRVLVVDDDPEVVRLLSRMLRSARRRYTVIAAHGGAEALQALAATPPDAVILDLLMPEVDGYTVLEHMQATPALADLPVIVVTARGREEEVVTAGLIGITRRSGFSIGEMMRCVQSSLGSLQMPTPFQARLDDEGASIPT